MQTFSCHLMQPFFANQRRRSNFWRTFTKRAGRNVMKLTPISWLTVTALTHCAWYVSIFPRHLSWKTWSKFGTVCFFGVFFVEGKHYLVFHTCQAEIQFWRGWYISVSYGCAYSFGNSIRTPIQSCNLSVHPGRWKAQNEPNTSVNILARHFNQVHSSVIQTVLIDACFYESNTTGGKQLDGNMA